MVVIGSANVDVSLTTATLPRPGETVAGDASTISVGGKGANQAAAAAACGACTHFVARIGADAFGGMVRDTLAARGVALDELRAVEGETTGLAGIYVDRAGQNCIVVVAGANGRLQPVDLEPLAPLIRAASLVVLQCETPLATVGRAIELAVREATPVILNPAPCRGLDLARLPAGITYLVPNESEAALLSGMPVASVDDAGRCGALLRGTGVECVIITLGAAGCVVVDDCGARHIEAHRVVPVDTTGAGDAFIGCLAAGIARGLPRDQAIRHASVYAALSTTRPGAQISYPHRAEFDHVIENLRHAT